MREILKSRDFKRLTVIAAIIAVVVILSASTPGRQNIFGTVIDFVTTPIQKLTTLLSGGIDAIGESTIDDDTLRSQNAIMSQKIAEMTAQMADYEQLKRENENLRNLLGIKKEDPKIEILPATVISRASDDEYYSFIIDQGSRDGVALYDPVITPEGLVGYISEIGPISSRVATILSPSTDVGAMDRISVDEGVLSGNSELAQQTLCKLSYLSRDCQVKVGDLIVTTGLGGKYPRNLVIGEVVDVRPEEQSTTFYATVKPAAAVKRCIDVFVITDFSSQGAVVDGELGGLEDEMIDGADQPAA